MSIPKIIWQTHNYEYDELPDYYKKIAQTWKNFNPDWEYRYVSHTEREEIIKKYPVLWEYYPTQDGVCQADIWRYVVTYEYGGVYADMDSVCTQSISYLLNTLDDAEFFVCPPNIWETSMQNQIKLLKSDGFTEDQIDFRIKVQTDRNGVRVYESPDGTMIESSTTKSSNYAIKKHSKIMKEIIKKCEDHFIYNINNDRTRVKLYVPFLDVVHGLENNNLVSFKFTAFHHDDRFKEGFYLDFLVNDCEVQMTYLDYLTKHNLPLC